MKILLFTFISIVSSLCAQGLKNYKPNEAELDKEEMKELLKKTTEDSQVLSKVQDELSADVQELIEIQTNDKVIILLEDVETLMAHVTDNLEDSRTGIETIGTETEIIQKIFEAAIEKSKSQSNSSQQSMGPILKQLQKMMGSELQEPNNSGSQNENAGESPGEGANGENTTEEVNRVNGGGGESGERTLKKKSGLKASDLPSEYQKLIDAYNSSQSN